MIRQNSGLLNTLSEKRAFHPERRGELVELFQTLQGAVLSRVPQSDFGSSIAK